MPASTRTSARTSARATAHPMAKLRDPLRVDLKKGSAPSTAASELPKWRYLVAQVKAHAQAIRDGNNAALDDELLGTHGFGGEVSLNGTNFSLSENGFETLVAALYSTLFKAYKVANRGKGAAPIERLLLELREAAALADVVTPTAIVQTFDVASGFGTGVTASSLSFLPDADIQVARGWESFGSAPVYDSVVVAAPSWKFLSRRQYESRANPPVYGATTHYILGHLINDNLNGSGSDARNLTPLWDTANKQMSSGIEELVKQAVLRGLEVEFEITPGPKKGDRSAVLAKVLAAYGKTKREDLPADGQLKHDIVAAEAHLLTSLNVRMAARDASGNSTAKLLVVTNYIPDTVPELTNPGVRR